MVAKQTSLRQLKSIAGAILLAIGFLVFFANLDAVAAQIGSAAGIPGEQTPGMLPALILATLHTLQAYVFDHAGFLSSLLQILVSFWPLILIIIGALLLHPVAKTESGPHGFSAARSELSARGDR